MRRSVSRSCAPRIPGAERQTRQELSRLEDFREGDEDSHGVHDDVDLARRTLDEQGRR
jgi:hypothetical protein